jgi:hypothetical protein
VVGGSIVMAIGAGVIALSSVSQREHLRWQEAAATEGGRYGVDPEYTRSGLAGEDARSIARRRSWIDWLIVSVATATIIGFAVVARPPQIALRLEWAIVLVIATVGVLVGAGLALWRATRFN